MIVNSIPNTEYKHMAKSIEELIDRGFKWSYNWDAYIYRFPVYSYKRRTILECIFITHLDENGLSPFIKVNVVCVDSGNFYSPFYIHNNGYNELINIINKKILEQMKVLQIAPVVRKKVKNK